MNAAALTYVISASGALIVLAILLFDPARDILRARLTYPRPLRPATGSRLVDDEVADFRQRWQMAQSFTGENVTVPTTALREAYTEAASAPASPVVLPTAPDAYSRFMYEFDAAITKEMKRFNDDLEPVRQALKAWHPSRDDCDVCRSDQP